MFESLSDQLTETLGKLSRKGRLTEADVDDAMKEVRRALLEADVNFRVVKDFVAAVRERAVGQDVLKSLTPAQTVIGILGAEAFEAAKHSGCSLTIDELVDLVNSVVARWKGEPGETGSSVVDLTEREREVLQLVVSGSSDREIGDALFISPRTASKHVGNILAKLGVTSRSEAAVIAIHQNLV